VAFKGVVTLLNMESIKVIGNIYKKHSNNHPRGIGKAAVAFILCLICLQCAVEANESFSFKNVRDKAQQLAAQPFKELTGQIPEFLMKINYDEWRDIRFKPEFALWRKERLPFTVQFFHPGLYYDRPVIINIVDRAGVKPVHFARNLFDYGKNKFKGRVPANLGFAGFRVHHPINTKKYYDEVAVFLGASYFRAVARKQNYGLSARALALDTALSSGEEFPYFKEFWIIKPVEESTRITVYALLDSTSVTGAYEFIIKPGKETIIYVKETVFMRKAVEKLGIAPLTSMFFYGENTSTSQRPVDDFRPEVHNSDGLLMSFSTGEWLWHPLVNPHTLIINSFNTVNPTGFGLMQRDTNFTSYQDLETRYENMPSVWITPWGKWGTGHIELIQIPTTGELNDNIIAFWAPEKQLGAGTSISFSYTMSWQHPDKKLPPAGRVISTYTAKGKTDEMKKFVIDFAGGSLDALPADKALAASVTVDNNAQLVEQQLFKNQVTGGWRLVFQIHPADQSGVDRVLKQKRQPIELRAFLKDGKNILTETWSYTYLP
jgi:glucans biosynthesis protein